MNGPIQFEGDQDDLQLTAWNQETSPFRRFAKVAGVRPGPPREGGKRGRAAMRGRGRAAQIAAGEAHPSPVSGWVSVREIMTTW